MDVEASVRQLGTLRSIVDDTTFASLVRDSVGDHPGSDIISLVERPGRQSWDAGSRSSPPFDDLSRPDERPHPAMSSPELD